MALFTTNKSKSRAIFFLQQIYFLLNNFKLLGAFLLGHFDIIERACWPFGRETILELVVGLLTSVFWSWLIRSWHDLTETSSEVVQPCNESIHRHLTWFLTCLLGINYNNNNNCYRIANNCNIYHNNNNYYNLFDNWQ